MKKYTNPSAAFTSLDAEDVITTSIVDLLDMQGNMDEDGSGGGSLTWGQN